jgi:hypothetical protein
MNVRKYEYQEGEWGIGGDVLVTEQPAPEWAVQALDALKKIGEKRSISLYYAEVLEKALRSVWPFGEFLRRTGRLDDWGNWVHWLELDDEEIIYIVDNFSNVKWHINMPQAEPPSADGREKYTADGQSRSVSPGPDKLHQAAYDIARIALAAITYPNHAEKVMSEIEFYRSKRILR